MRAGLVWRLRAKQYDTSRPPFDQTVNRSGGWYESGFQIPVRLKPL
jgi:hypothetical protein